MKNEDKKITKRPIKKTVAKTVEPVSIEGVEVKAPLTGVGDVVAKVTSFFGIEPCSDCEERREKMNQLWSFLKNVRRELTDDEITYLREIERTNNVPNGEVFVQLFNEIYGTSQKSCQCPSIYRDILNKMIMQVIKQEIV